VGDPARVDLGLERSRALMNLLGEAGQVGQLNCRRLVSGGHGPSCSVNGNSRFPVAWHGS
jgi:hypothetical protein